LARPTIKSKLSWSQTTQRNLDFTYKGQGSYIQHIIKEFRSLGKQLGKIHDSKQDVKDVSKELLYKKHNTKCVFTKKRDVPRYYRT
jgi:CHAD domain-containing protein